MANNTGYTNPKCKGCGVEIEFIQLRNHKGEIKAHPVEADKNYMIMATGDKTDKGQYIYESRRILTSHFSKCPAAQKFRDQAKEQPAETTKPQADDDKPPF
jgi:hypothetical protein